MFNTVDYEINDDIARIYLNRPERLNAVIPQLVEDLCQAIDQSQKDDARVLILAGRGKAFCAGFDLKHEEDSISEMEHRRRFQRIQDVSRKIRNATFPVVAMVHGYALGAGFEFALSCDLILATEDAKFAFPEVNVGLSVGCGVSHILPNTIGLIKAKELIFFSEKISAQQAQSLGLINNVFKTEDLENEVIRVCKQIKLLPQLALTQAKIALNHGAQSDIEASYGMETNHAITALQSVESKISVEAFRNK